MLFRATMAPQILIASGMRPHLGFLRTLAIQFRRVKFTGEPARQTTPKNGVEVKAVARYNPGACPQKVMRERR